MAFVYRRIFGRGWSGALSRPFGVQTSLPSSYGVQAATSVTTDTALQVSTVWACVKLICESLASLPLQFYTVLPDGTWQEEKKHDVAQLFIGKVNQWQNRFEYFETVAMNLVLKGNAYSLKQFNGQNQLIGLQPMISDQMDVILEDSGAVMYQYREGANVKVYHPDRIWHVRGMGNGLIGLSPLDYMRNSVGVGQAAENAVSKIYRNGGKPGGILTIDKLLKADQRAAIKASFAELEEGTDDRLFVLEADMKYQQVKMTPSDIELLETRIFQIDDICRFFGVPSPIVSAAKNGEVWSRAFSEVLQGFYKTALRPYITRLESSIESSLLKPAERGVLRPEFDTSDFLRMSEKDRIETNARAIDTMQITPNEARKSEGRVPKDGGNELYAQKQMVPIGMLKDVHKPKPAPTPSTPALPAPAA